MEKRQITENDLRQVRAENSLAADVIDIWIAQGKWELVRESVREGVHA